MLIFQTGCSDRFHKIKGNVKESTSISKWSNSSRQIWLAIDASIKSVKNPSPKQKVMSYNYRYYLIINIISIKIYLKYFIFFNFEIYSWRRSTKCKATILILMHIWMIFSIKCARKVTNWFWICVTLVWYDQIIKTERRTWSWWTTY